MIYFDNAATTNHKPFCVKWAAFKALSKKYCANPGRSSHKPSLLSGMEVFETRDRLNRFFHNDDVNRVIFFGSCTEALNTAIFGLLKDGDHVIISCNEHNSVARPIFMLQDKKKITVTVAESTNLEHTITAEQIEKSIRPETKLIAVCHTSNVTGATCDIAAIGKLCKKHNIPLLVDAAQSAGHEKIDMIRDNIDILAIAGHKGLMAMQGIGVLLFRSHINILPLKFGGTGTHSENLTPPISYPESLEAGTPATPNIFTLKSGLEYVEKNFAKINQKIENLSKFLIQELSTLKQVILYTDKNCHKGVVSFNLKGVPCSEVVSYFNEHNVCTRGGFHCAPLAHKTIQTDKIGGTVRISLSSFNHIWQIKRAVKLLKQYPL